MIPILVFNKIFTDPQIILFKSNNKYMDFVQKSADNLNDDIY